MSESAAANLDEGAIEAFLADAYNRSSSTQPIPVPEENVVIDGIVQYVIDYFLAEKTHGRGGKRPKYVLGLSLSFIRLAEDVKDALGEVDTFSSKLTQAKFFRRYPRHPDKQTLSLQAGKRSFGIRATYNKVADFFQHKLERTSFPHAPGDATGKWRYHTQLLLDCFRLSSAGRRRACRLLLNFGMAQYPRNTAFGQPTLRPRLFPTIIETYPRSDPNEEAGSVYHAITYGLLTADRSHLRLITEKSRGSTKRQLRIGDIDCYYGADLELALEVKDLEIKIDNLEAQVGTFARAVRDHGVMGMVFVKTITPEAVTSLRNYNVLALSEAQLKEQIELGVVASAS